MPFYEVRRDSDRKVWRLAGHLNRDGALMWFNNRYAKPEVLGTFTFDDDGPANYALVEQEMVNRVLAYKTVWFIHETSATV